jgi:4-amino-4-deoxy-L-arabinose transferase-like glycosyltransferase
VRDRGTDGSAQSDRLATNPKTAGAFVTARALVLVALCGFTFFFKLSAPAIVDSDEGFYAEAAREMLESGDWITPHFNYAVRLDKPILFYWLVGFAYVVTGVGEAAARVFAAVCGLGLVLLAYVVGQRWIGPATGFLAGSIAATCFGIGWMARQALPDLPLAFFVTLGTWAAIEAVTPGARHARRWLVLAAIALGLGALTKGPIALAVPAVVVAPLMWWERRSVTRDGRTVMWPFGVADVITASAVLVLIAAPWYVLAEIANPGTSARFILRENVARFATSRFNPPRGAFYYLPVLLAMLAPWTPFLLLWIAPVWRRIRTRRSLARVEIRLFCWIAAPLVLFSLSYGKQPRYMLPCLVPLILLLARTVAWRAFHRPRQPVFMVAGLASGLLMIQVAVSVARGREALAAVDAGWSLTPVVGIGLAGTIAVLAALLAPRRLPGAIAVTSLAMLVAYHEAVHVRSQPEAVEVVASRVRDDRPDVVCACGVFDRSLGFYAQRKVVRVSSAEHIRDLLASPQRVYAAVEAEKLSAVESLAGRRYPVVLDVPYFNSAAVRAGPFREPGLPLTAQRVLLVRNR